MNQLADWFEENIEYSGDVTLNFYGTLGQSHGYGRVYLDNNRKWRLEIKNNSFERSENKNHIILDMSQKQGVKNICLPLKFGKYQASNDIGYNINFSDMSEMTLSPHYSEFKAYETNKPAFLVVPLFNFTCDAFQEREDNVKHLLTVSKHSLKRIIYFGKETHSHFLELLPEYDNILAKLDNNEIHSAITAVLVLSLSTLPERFLKFEKNDLMDVIRFVSVCSKSVVGASWYEYRDEEGNLIRRIQGNWDVVRYTKTIPIIKSDSDDFKQLLDTWLESDLFGNTRFRILLRHIQMSTADEQTLEDGFVLIIYAFELLSRLLQIENHDLKEKLDDITIRSVNQILQNASTEINRLDRGSSDPNALEEIAYRVIHTPLGKANSFGMAICEICQKRELIDEFIANQVCGPGKLFPNFSSWSKLLTSIRGDLIHNGYLDYSGHHDISYFIQLRNHLFDLLVRIALHLIGYKGRYNSELWRTNINVDWLKREMGPEVLRYGKV